MCRKDNSARKQEVLPLKPVNFGASRPWLLAADFLEDPGRPSCQAIRNGCHETC